MSWHLPRTWKPGDIRLTAAILNREIRDKLQYLYDNISGGGYSIEAWQPASALLVNSWADVGGGETASAYRKDSNGFVYLRGVLEGGSANTIMFTLPTGYRPASIVRVPVAPERPYNGFVKVETNGDVKFFPDLDWVSASTYTAIDCQFHVD